ncbi:MAG: AEC family transporter [Alcaligenaceae bacterium]
MNVALLVLPDFLLIGFGWLLHRKFSFTREFFASLEKLVYYVLFPALLFQAIVRIPITVSSAADLFFATASVAAIGVVLSWLALPFFRPTALAMASGAQCGYRFNTYIALALAPSLAGAAGQTTMALIVGFAVPLVNLAAVYALARQQGSGLFGALLRNPLLMSTVLALVCNFAGLQLPQPVDTLLARLGSASIALGILCVGASLTWQPGQTQFSLIGWMLAIKLLLLPACAWFIADWLGLDPLKRQMVILFAAMPPATGAYVLAVRMGGDGRLVSLMISIGIPLSSLTIPLWLLLIA